MKKKCIFTYRIVILCIFTTIPTFSQATFFDSQCIINELVNTAALLISGQAAAQSAINRIRVVSNEQDILEKELSINVNQEITDFFTSELKKVTTKTIDAVKINIGCSTNQPIVSLNKHILIAQYVADEISNALKTNNQNTLNKWRAVIQHEATHIHNNDLSWRSIIDLTALAIGQAMRIHYTNYLFSISNLTCNEKRFFKIHAAICTLLIIEGMRMAFYRYQEKRADMNIANDINLLNGMKQFLHDIEQIDLKNHAYLTPTMYKITRWINNIFEAHPLNSKRIEKLDQRIAQIQKATASASSIHPTIA